MNNEIILLILVLVSMAFVYLMLNKANKQVKLPAYKPSGYEDIDLNDYSLQIFLKGTTKEYILSKIKEYVEISSLGFNADEFIIHEKNEWLICRESGLMKNNFFNFVLWLSGNEGEINIPYISAGIAVSNSGMDYFYCIPDKNNVEDNILTGAFSDGKKFYCYAADVQSANSYKNEKVTARFILSEYVNIDIESFTELIKDIEPGLLK